jgi:antitoxin HicB
MKMFYHFKKHEEPDGYWADCIEFEGCVTQGDSLEELQKNMGEALNLFLDEPENTNVTFPMPDKEIKGENIVEVPVHPKIAFALVMRMLRRQKGLTQSEIAKLLGMKNIYSYQRLERPKHANPSLTTLAKIKKAFPDFKIDELLFSESGKK